ncbi:NAD(P)-binding protein [Biscogniauxia mediterranea]|nr:NAD(P)-binding protein [Biscogniauxia mediterranea]
MATAKSLVVKSIRDPPDVEIVNKPVPVAAQGTAVIEVLASSVGASHQYLVSHEVPGFGIPLPGVFGGCAVGRVVSAGADSTALRPGQLVLADNFIAARDDPDVELLLGLMDGGTAKSKKLAGEVWRDGHWQTHTTVPLENATPLDEDLLLGKLGYDVAELTYLARLAVAYGAVSTLDIKAGETVIVGPATGQFGGAAVEVASAVGARVIAIGRNVQALARLKATVPRVETVVLTGDAGADAQALRASGPADAFIEFSPHTMTSEPTYIKSALGALRRRGRAAFMGGLGRDVSIPYFQVVLNSLEVKGRWMYTRKELRALIKLVETGVLKIGKPAGHEVSGRFKLEDWEAALDAGAKNSAWGQTVVFTP